MRRGGRVTAEVCIVTTHTTTFFLYHTSGSSPPTIIGACSCCTVVIRRNQNKEIERERERERERDGMTINDSDNRIVFFFFFISCSLERSWYCWIYRSLCEICVDQCENYQTCSLRYQKLLENSYSYFLLWLFEERATYHIFYWSAIYCFFCFALQYWVICKWCISYFVHACTCYSFILILIYINTPVVDLFVGRTQQQNNSSCQKRR